MSEQLEKDNFLQRIIVAAGLASPLSAAASVRVWNAITREQLDEAIRILSAAKAFRVAVDASKGTQA